MKREIIYTQKAPKPGGGILPRPYSQTIRAGSFIFVSGQGPDDPKTGKNVGGDFKSQVRQTLENIKAILEAAGSSMQDVVKATVYINDIKNWSMLNEVWVRYFPKNPPARACVEIPHLDFATEIEVIAIVPEQS